jgi:hypothetical protein
MEFNMKNFCIVLAILFILMPATVHAQITAIPSAVQAISNIAYGYGGILPYAATGGEAAGAVSWGNVFKVGGIGVGLGFLATVSALDWFYDEVKRESGNTDLDEWASIKKPDYLTKPQPQLPPNNSLFRNRELVFECSWWNGSLWTQIGVAQYPGEAAFRPFRYQVGGYDIYGSDLSNLFDAKAVFGAENGCPPSVGRPTIQQWIDGDPTADPPILPHPNARQGLKRAMGDYLRDKAVRDLANDINVPGITFNPPSKRPNKNQWTDSLRDPLLDTDQDGATDGEEFPMLDPDQDPSNPLIKPDPEKAPCRSGGGTWNPSGSPKCTPAADPEQAQCQSSGGTWNASGSPKCTPAADPEQAQCQSSGGTWNASGSPKCTPAADPEQAQCQSSGGTWNASGSPKCTPAKTDKEKCQQAGGVWDEMSKSCGTNPTIDGTGECAKLQGQGLTGFIGNFWGSLRDTFLCVFKPQENIPDKLTSRFQTIKTKFPFSVVTALQNKVIATGDSNPDGLPSSLGNIPLDWSGINTLWAIIKTASGFLIWFSFIWFIVSKITPQTTI